MNVLMQQQEELEAEAVGLGIERYRKEVARGLEETHPGRKMIKAAVLKLTEVLDDYIAKALEGTPSRSLGVLKYMQQFDTDLLALVVATKVVRGFGAQDKHQKLTALALSITGILEDSINFETIREKAPRLHKSLQNKLSKSRDARYRHIVIRKAQEYIKVECIKWGLAERARLGTLLIELMCHATGLCRTEVQWEGVNKSVNVVVPTEETIAWLQQSHSRSELLSPVHMPMIVPPKKWEGPTGGGYLTRPLRLKLVKTRNSNLLEELRNANMPNVYSALNALQDTRWHINAGILRIVKEVWESGRSIGKLPPRDNIPMPAKGPNVDTNADALKQYKVARAIVHAENVRLVSKRIAMTSKIWVAEKFSQHEAIHFVHNLDWRGRAYAVANYVNPQGDDSGKALLEFADGKALGDGGAYWLAVHGANCYGVDKVSFDERIEWVQAHYEDIMDSALRPLEGAGFWCGPEVDKPWQFLAFCMEWAALSIHCNTGAGAATYVSRLPVGLDGSCNGLQNFSMVTRDEIGGAATNLIPSDKPSDIYAQVAAAASSMVDRDAQTGESAAKMWKGKVSRKVAKRPTMTMPYGSGRFGFKDQLMDTLRKLDEETGAPYIDGDKYVASLYMANVMDNAISTVVVKAREAMDWLQAAARVVAKDGLPVRWTTPSGFPAVQDYRFALGKMLDFDVAGKRFQLTVEIEGFELDKKKQAQGIAPNVVHSWDAAHLVGTVNECMSYGIKHFSMVHDSFGVHAADVDTLAHCLRKAFVDQYREDVLGKLRDQIIEQITDDELRRKIPPLPSYGNLDIDAVMQSQYFFA